MKALIVEDHLPTSQLLARTLTASGHDSEVCYTAEDALQLLKERGLDEFQLYLLDLKLPGIDGISLCRWIRARQEDSEPYVIVGTGSDHSEELANAFDAGADDYIEKPYAPKILTLRFAVASEQIVAREERKRLNNELNREKDFIAALFDTAAAFIVALDPDGRITKVNQATCELSGRQESHLQGEHFYSALLDSEAENDDIRQKLENLRPDRGHTCQFESQFTGSSGETQTIAWLCRLVEDHTGDHTENGEAPVIVCVGTDITVRRKMEAQLAFLAERDPLTNLYNRSQLEPAVQAAIDATRAGHPSSVMCVDLDDFKAVNDSAGHAAGDDLLQIVSATLSRSVRSTDTVMRLGGDEFVLVLAQSPLELSREIANRIRDAIDNLTFVANGRTFHITSSIGLVMLESRMTIEEALGRADAACYTSKANGRNKVTIGGENSEHPDESTNDTEWYERITDAIAYDAIDLWIQPVVHIATGQTSFYEALLRLPGEDGWHSPGQFMHSARRFNLLPEIDRSVIRNALDMMRCDPTICLTINLSGRTASDSRLPSFLVAELRRSGVDPARLLFEITETELITDLPNAADRLNELRDHGFRFALDDFGQGYSSFNYLRTLPVEIIKIDGSYTRSLQEDEHSVAFVRSITELAHSIGIRCAAEHVETEDSLRILAELGVDFAQGFHLGKPEPVKQRQTDRIRNADRENDLLALPS